MKVCGSPHHHAIDYYVEIGFFWPSYFQSPTYFLIKTSLSMKTFIVLFTLCFIGMFFLSFSFASCHKNQKAEDFPVPPSMKASMKHATSPKRFSKTAGSLFSRDTLNAWVANYKKTFKTS